MARKRSHTPDLARKRGRVACISCRQAKVRCNFTEIPCSRCARLHLDCSVDPEYKRTNKRDKVHELEDNVQALRSLIEKQQSNENEAPETITPTIQTSESGPPTDGPCAAHPSQIISDVLPSPKVWKDEKGTEMRALGDVSLASTDVDSLFSLYFEKYHRHLPILDPTRSPSAYYDLSTPLFWTIISVALRGHWRDDRTLPRLISVLCTHLWSEIGSSKKNLVGVDASNVHEIQAMLLLATWPLPNVRLWSDRSLIQTNLAISSAMHIGLHRPGYDFEYARNPPNLNERTYQERSSTWIACYCHCVSLSLEAGHCPLVPATDWLINKVTYHVPEVFVPLELRHYAIIEKQAHDAFQIFLQMHENPAAIAQEPNFFTSLSACEQQFEATFEKYQQEMSVVNQARSRGNILLLQLLYFLADQSHPNTRAGLMRAYRTSNRIIATLISEDDINEILVSVPYILLRIMLRAAFTLQRVYFSTYSQEIDHITCKVLFDSATVLIRQMATAEDKENQPKRVVEALKMTWKHMEKDPSLFKQDPTLKIRSRLGASMQYDCLMYYRDAVKRASQKQKGENQIDETTVPTNIPPLTPSRQGFDTYGSSWQTPAFENFLETDLSWLDDLVTAGPFPGTH